MECISNKPEVEGSQNQNLLVNKYQRMNSQTSRVHKRVSPSPTPCRSPSPDLMIKSSIVSTVNLPKSPLQSTSFSISTPSISKEELNHLRQENKKLREMISSGHKGKEGQFFNSMIEEKDRVIAELQERIRNYDKKSQKGPSMMSSTDRREEESKVKEQLQIIKKLRERILQLEVDNQQLKKKKSNPLSESTKLKPVRMDDPLPYMESPEASSLIDFVEIKEKLTSELNYTISSFSRQFVSKLEELESRLKTIDTRLEATSMSNSGYKQTLLTTGNLTSKVSPFESSNRGQYDYNTSEVPAALSQKLTELKSELLEVRSSQIALRRKVAQLQDVIQRKDDDLRTLRNQLQLSTTIRDTQTDNLQQKHRLIQQNTGIKQSLSRLSNQVINLKNNQANYKKENQWLKQELEVEKSRKMSGYLSPPEEDHMTRQLQSLNQQLQNEIRSLNDTLSSLRRSLEETQSSNYTLERENGNLKLENTNLSRQVDSLIEQRQQIERENLSLKLRVSEIEGIGSDNQYLSSQISNLRIEVTQFEQTERNLRRKLLETESSNVNLQAEIDRVGSDNESLRRRVNTNSRENLELMQNSDHTKQVINRLNQQKLSLELQLSRLIADSKNTQNTISAVHQRISNLELIKAQVEAENRLLKQQLNASQYSLNQSKLEIQKLYKLNKLLEDKNFELSNECNRLRMDQGKESLTQQIESLTERLREAEVSSSNFRALEEQRNNQLQSALAELAEVKATLSKISFEGVEQFIKQLQTRQYTQEQQKYQSTHKYLEENQTLRKENLSWMTRYTEEKSKGDRMANSINLLEGANRNLTQKIEGLQQIINQYRADQQQSLQPKHETNSVMEQILETRSSNGTEIEKSMREIDNIKEPIHQAVLKLDKIAEKIQAKIGNRRSRANGLTISSVASQK